jgi:hypothetical protein
MKCPNCKKETAWESNPYRPFCSERCQLLDFGAWIDEEYRVADKTDDTEIIIKTRADEDSEKD